MKIKIHSNIHFESKEFIKATMEDILIKIHETAEKYPIIADLSALLVEIPTLKFIEGSKAVYIVENSFDTIEWPVFDTMSDLKEDLLRTLIHLAEANSVIYFNDDELIHIHSIILEGNYGQG